MFSIYLNISNDLGTSNFSLGSFIKKGELDNLELFENMLFFHKFSLTIELSLVGTLNHFIFLIPEAKS